MAVHGFQAMIVVGEVIEDARGELIEVILQDADSVSLAIWAVLPARHYMLSRVHCFIEELKSSLAFGPEAGKSSSP